LFIPCIPVGAAAAASVANFKQWLDSLALGCMRGGGTSNPLVKGFNGNQIPGLYDCMRSGEHARFLTSLVSQTTCQTQCAQQNLSAGRLITVQSSERGQMLMMEIKGGPF